MSDSLIPETSEVFETSEALLVLPPVEAVDLINSRQKSNPSFYRGMMNVYEAIVEATGRQYLLSQKVLQEKLGTDYHYEAILKFLTAENNKQGFKAPAVLAHLYFLLDSQKKLQADIIYVAHKDSKIMFRAVEKYDSASVDNIMARAGEQRGAPFESLESQEKYLFDRLGSGEFRTTYALWFLEERIEALAHEQDMLYSIFERSVLPRLKHNRLLYYRDVTESFWDHGLRPIILFNEPKWRLNRYRVLLRYVLEKLTPPRGYPETRALAREIKEELEEGEEYPERHAELMKQLFEYLKATEGGAQQLQIVFELYGVKDSVNGLMREELSRFVAEQVEVVKNSGSIYTYPGGSQVRDRVRVQLRSHSEVHAVEYPLVSGLTYHYVHRANVPKILEHLREQIELLKHGRSKMMRDNIQTSLEIMESLVVMGDRVLNEIMRDFIESQMGFFKRLIYTFFYPGAAAKQMYRDKIWEVVLNKTEKSLERLKQAKRDDEQAQLERNLLKRQKELSEDKEAPIPTPELKPKPPVEEEPAEAEPEQQPVSSKASPQAEEAILQIIQKMDQQWDDLMSKSWGVNDFLPPGISHLQTWIGEHKELLRDHKSHLARRVYQIKIKSPAKKTLVVSQEYYKSNLVYMVQFFEGIRSYYDDILYKNETDRYNFDLADNILTELNSRRATPISIK